MGEPPLKSCRANIYFAGAIDVSKSKQGLTQKPAEIPRYSLIIRLALGLPEDGISHICRY